MTGRFPFPREQLRARTVRGVAVTAAFLVAIDGLVLAQGLIVTRLLGPEAIGLYGIVSITVMSLIMVKRSGVGEGVRAPGVRRAGGVPAPSPSSWPSPRRWRG